MGTKEHDGYVMKVVDESNPTYTFAWIIDHPDLCCKVVYKSEEFYTGEGDNQDVWQLVFQTQFTQANRSQASTLCCCLALHLLSCAEPGIQKVVTFSYVGYRQKSYEKITEIVVAEEGTYDLQSLQDPYPVSGLSRIGHDKLIICCKISNAIYRSLISDLTNKMVPGMNTFLEHRMSRDFEVIMKSEALSDVTLRANGKDFHVHKAILASRSPVFLATFVNDMKEKRSNAIDIPDVKPEVMQELLNYIYTDEVQNLEELAEDLIVVAEKYQIQGLKSLCTRELAENLDATNAIETLILSDLHHADDLKNQTYSFIASNVDNIRKLEGYDTLKTTRQGQNILEALTAIENLKIKMN